MHAHKHSRTHIHMDTHERTHARTHAKKHPHTNTRTHTHTGGGHIEHHAETYDDMTLKTDNPVWMASAPAQVIACSL